MELKRIDPTSCAKVLGILYAFFGLLGGAVLSVISIVRVILGGGEDALPVFLLGIGAVIVLPIFYGVMGAISGLITALLYNVSARMTGGLKLEFS